MGTKKAFTPSFAYLLGLINGKGLLFEDRLQIEFVHKNEFVSGIGYCPICGYMATGFREKLKCSNKSCNLSKKPYSIDRKVRKQYPQRQMFKESLQKNVIPFLEENLEFTYELLRSNTYTLFSLRFTNKALHNHLISLFENENSFERFQIPKSMHSQDKNIKIEFINGLLDSTSYPSLGGWDVRMGASNYGRMRPYFQIVQRNWFLPIQIDNFLRDHFNLNTQKIRYGHPNINDPAIQEYLERGVNTSREHQVGFFPEYFIFFKHRLSPKKELWNELVNHNKNAGFNKNEDWLKAKKIIKESEIKSFHPMEKDKSIPKQFRKHYNASWQISLDAGCKYLNQTMKQSKDPTLFCITGEENVSGNYKERLNRFNEISLKKYDEQVKNFKPKKIISKTRERSHTERDLYDPLVECFKKHLSKKHNQEVEVFDTSSSTLTRFFAKHESLERIEEFEKLSIRPDLIGLLKISKELVFIEVKNESIGIKEFGQIVAYSLVGNPFESYIVSTNRISPSLNKALSLRKDLGSYFDKGIIICHYQNHEISIEGEE